MASDDRETYEAIEQRRNDPEFMARLRHRIAQDKPILDRLAKYEAHDAYRTQAEETIARLRALVAHRTAERDALAAAVDRVRALADTLDVFVDLRRKDHVHDDYNKGVERAVTDLRAALDGEGARDGK
jgi:hypothetical protein